MINYFVFDIETGKNAFSQEMVKDFDYSSVKIGDITRRNLPGHEKEAMINEKKREAAAEYYRTASNKFPLYGISGRVLIITCYDSRNGGKVTIFDLEKERSEKEMLLKFYALIREVRAEGAVISGFNIGNFDIPFLHQRAWVNEVVPYPFYEGKWLSPYVVDLFDVWTFQKRTLCTSGEVKQNLDQVCKAVGAGEKIADVGKNFEKIYLEQRPIALEYAIRDLEITVKLYEILINFNYKIKHEELDFS